MSWSIKTVVVGLVVAVIVIMALSALLLLSMHTLNH